MVRKEGIGLGSDTGVCAAIAFFSYVHVKVGDSLRLEAVGSPGSGC